MSVIFHGLITVWNVETIVLFSFIKHLKVIYTSNNNIEDNSYIIQWLFLLFIYLNVFFL